MVKAILHTDPFKSPSRCVFLSFSGIYRELCLESVKHKYECETQAACQHWEVRDTPTFSITSLVARSFKGRSHLRICVFVQSEKLLLFDTVQNELEEKIRRLEEDRHSIGITSGKALRAETLRVCFLLYLQESNTVAS